MTSVESWRGSPAVYRSILLRITLAGADGITRQAAVDGLPAADAVAALAQITDTPLVTATDNHLTASPEAVALVHQLTAEAELADALTEATRRRRAPVTTEEVVQRVVVALADHGPLTLSALSTRHLSARQRVVLDAALGVAVERGAVRWAPGRKLIAADTGAVGVSGEDVAAARQRRETRSAKFASGEVEG